MRIACVYLPSFPLQVHVRRAPHLAGESFAAIDGEPHPAVVVCSRAAWNAGVRPGMPAAAARSVCPELQVVPADARLCQRALQALADSLLCCADLIDVGHAPETAAPHQAVYVEVPPSSRGASFGKKLLTQLSRQGFRGRVGIADDRFTAWAAATTVRGVSRPPANGESPLFTQTCTTVPRGGSAAFLAPLSVDLLPLDRDVADMLDALGVHTLGQFAALPPPSVSRPGDPTAAFQALARGDGPSNLTPYRPASALSDAIELPHPVDHLEPLSFVLRPLGDRLCERLRGRERAAGEARLHLEGPGGEVTEVPVAPPLPAVTAASLVDAARKHLSRARVDHPIALVELEITREVEPDDDDLDLFSNLRGAPDPDDVDVAIARLQSAFGAGSEPGGRCPAPTTTGRAPRRTRRGKERRRHPSGTGRQRAAAGSSGVMPSGVRLLDPPALQPTDLRTIEVGNTSLRVVASHPAGPAGAQPASQRDYYEVETDDGGRYWVFRQTDGRYYLHGIFD